jgi:hypothetical protein
MTRLPLALLIGFWATAVTGQPALVAVPNPYDHAASAPLVLTNGGPGPIVLDSLRFTSSFQNTPYAWGIAHRGLHDGEEVAGWLGCSPYSDWPCMDGSSGDDLIGRVFAPSDSVALRLSAYCICRVPGGGTQRDTLLIYAGGSAEPLAVAIHDVYVEVSSEPPPDATPSRLEVYPNPARGGATARVRVASPGTLEVRVLDVAGRVVMGPVERASAGGEVVVPLSLTGLAAGYYSVDARFTSALGRAAWLHQALVVLD